MSTKRLSLDSPHVCSLVYVTFAGVFLIIGVIVYGTDVKSDASFKAKDLYAGFGLSIIAAIAIIIAGIISFFVH